MPDSPCEPRHDQLDEPRQHRTCPVPAEIPIVRHVAPAEDRQPFRCRNPLHGRRLRRCVSRIDGQERQPGRVAPGRRKIKFTAGAQQRIWHLGEDAGAVARIRIGALGASVVEIAQHRQGIGNRLVAALASEVSHEADAAGVVLVTAVVEACPALMGGRCHPARSCRLIRRHEGAVVGSGRHWPWSRRDNTGPAAHRQLALPAHSQQYN